MIELPRAPTRTQRAIAGFASIFQSEAPNYSISLADAGPPIVLLEGPAPAQMPDVHTNALKGAMLSLAVMWRLPVIHARDPEDSLRILRWLAGQITKANVGILQRYDRQPKRLASRKL